MRSRSATRNFERQIRAFNPARLGACHSSLRQVSDWDLQCFVRGRGSRPGHHSLRRATIEPVDDALAAELADRMARDQAARNEWGPRASVEAVERVVQVDRENSAWLRRVLDRIGWPGRSMVGDVGAEAAWLLAQHADHDSEFQQLCLDRLAEAVQAGEAQPSHLAYLTDRVRCAQGQPQVYGTQFWRGPDGAGAVVARPMEDEEHVDERRAAAGLEPFADNAARIREQYGEQSPSRLWPEWSGPPAGIE